MRTAALRVLDDRDRAAALVVLARDPRANVFVASRVRAHGLDPWRLGGEVWAFTGDGSDAAPGGIRALCYVGANLVPVAADEAAIAAFADRARRERRRCSSLVGPARMVLPLWEALEPTWGRAREVRGQQPLLALEREPDVGPDPLVRRVTTAELDVLLPASIAMFTEEVGVSPLGSDGGVLYRSRVRELVAAGRAFARIEDGRVVFKAEVGAVSPEACQVQGVWVAPEHRGRGLAAPGMAAVVRAARAAFAPSVTLYVNDFNAAARATYARVGFEEIDTFASVLF